MQIATTTPGRISLWRDLRGLGGADELRGGDGPDAIDGGAGPDVLDGGFGDDVITGGPGADRISADLAGGDCGPLWCKEPSGNDVVQARDGEADSITCGPGTDRAVVDRVDTVAPDCETVETVSEPAAGCPAAKTALARASEKLRTAIRSKAPRKRLAKVRRAHRAAAARAKAAC